MSEDKLRCELCGKILSKHELIEYRHRNFCFNCYEVKYLVDGLMLDFKIDTVELMVLADEVEHFCRGYTEIN